MTTAWWMFRRKQINIYCSGGCGFVSFVNWKRLQMLEFFIQTSELGRNLEEPLEEIYGMNHPNCCSSWDGL
jgi:hypothetical protein